MLLGLIIGSLLGMIETKSEKQVMPMLNMSQVRAFQSPKKAIDFSSNPIALKYKKVLIYGYKQPINFAMYYVLVTWGCGSGCISGAIIDSRDGRVYPLPRDDDWGGNGTYLKFDKTSRKLIGVWVIPMTSDKNIEIEKYWYWDESNKFFKLMLVDDK